MRALLPLGLALASLSALAAEPRLPDTLGFHPGMPAADVVKRMRELKLTITPHEVNPFNALDKPILYSLTGLRQGATSGPDERVVAELATPPTAQVVWRVMRTSSYPQSARPTVATVVAILREKYGTELWKDLDNEGHVRHMRWLFDERGAALQGDANANLARGCNIAGANSTTFSSPVAQKDPCNGVVHLTVVINAQQQRGVADLLEIQLVNPVLASRFVPATNLWLEEQKNRAANRQIEDVQRQGVKPSL